MLEKEKKQVVDFGKKLFNEGYTSGTGGNLSVFNREHQLMAISPSGIPFNDVKEEDVVIMQLDGKIIEGEKKPSSEWVMHKIFYEKRLDIDALIHGHTIYTTTLSLLREPLPASHYMVALAGKDVRCAEYATFGTEALAENAFAGMKDRKAVILANHGILTGAADLANAYNILTELEYCANIHIKARSIGTPVVLDDAEMELMAEKFKSYGQVKQS